MTQVVDPLPVAVPSRAEVAGRAGGAAAIGAALVVVLQLVGVDMDATQGAVLAAGLGASLQTAFPSRFGA